MPPEHALHRRQGQVTPPHRHAQNHKPPPPHARQEADTTQRPHPTACHDHRGRLARSLSQPPPSSSRETAPPFPISTGTREASPRQATLTHTYTPPLASLKHPHRDPEARRHVMSRHVKPPLHTSLRSAKSPSHPDPEALFSLLRSSQPDQAALAVRLALELEGGAAGHLGHGRGQHLGAGSGGRGTTGI